MLEARLVSISRGFAGDNATYELHDPARPERNEIAVVGVGWGLLTPYRTTIVRPNQPDVIFDDPEYVQPHVALARLGYEVHGAVDFAACVPAITPAICQIVIPRCAMGCSSK